MKILFTLYYFVQVHEWLSRQELEDSLTKYDELHRKQFGHIRTGNTVTLNNDQYTGMLELLQIPHNVNGDLNVTEISTAYYMRNGVRVAYHKGSIVKTEEAKDSFLKIKLIFLEYQTLVAVCGKASAELVGLFPKVDFNISSTEILVKVNNLSRPMAYYTAPSSSLYILNHRCV